MRCLVWFRADLRTDDNTALHAACRESDDGVIGVFVVCPEQWAEHDWAPVKVDFILRTLGALSDALKKLNIPLLIVSTPRFGGVPGALLRLARRHNCDRLHFNREYEVNERRRDDAVVRAFEGEGRSVRRHHDQTVVEPGAVRTTSGGFYSVFTPFRTKWMSEVHRRGGISPLSRPKRRNSMPCQPDDVPRAVKGFDLRNVAADLWPAGESAAADRLKGFCRRSIMAYRDRRDAPGVEDTSRLSPYLTVGSISARRCVRAALDACGIEGEAFSRARAGPATWISEIIWRDFYRHVLVGWPRVSMGRAFDRKTERVEWSGDEEGFAAWQEGRTGVPIVDASMRQLAAEGWMHNRLRMVAAMFLTKNLLVDWRWGERHFMRNLIDGDLASNNGGWQWSASTGTDAAPYFRVFNPVSQSKRFDPEGEFIRRYVPELADVDAAEVHDPAPLMRHACGYPEAIVDLKASRRRAIEAFGALGR